MGRQVRRVAANWLHPKDSEGNYIPLFEAPWINDWVRWEIGRRNWLKGRMEGFLNPWEPIASDSTWEDWVGEAPRKDSYAPDESLGHCYQMYEDTSECTPVHPYPFYSPENLAASLERHKVSRWGDATASKDEWLNIINGGFGGLLTVRIQQEG